MFRARPPIKFWLILLILQPVLCDWKPTNPEKETLCKTSECMARGEEYKNNLNTKANPCHDFYKFTCGNWKKNHPGPKYAPMWNILDVINFDFLNIIRKTLESYNYQQGDDISFRQAKIAYETCIKIPEYPIKDAKDIARAVTNVGRFPQTPVWDIHRKYLQLSGESALFRTAILGNKLSTVPVLMLMEPHSAYGSIFHEESWKPLEKHTYTNFLFRIMKTLKLKNSDALIRRSIEKVFQFREKLNRIIRENKIRNPDAFQLFTGQELNNWFSNTLRQLTNTQKIPWNKVIDALMQSMPPEQRRTGKMIAMRQKQYFVDLMNLLKNTNEEVLANHMEIYFVESHVKLDEKLYKLLEGTSIEPHGLNRYIRVNHNPRWQTCIENFNLKEVFEELLYQKWFPKDIPDKIRAMSSKLKLAIRDQMRQSSWLDNPTRDETTSKINKVVEWVGFPPWIYNKMVDTIERDPNDILTPTAYLYTQMNMLYIHAPLLLPPMYSSTIPSVYNYAGMGSALGHELYHVINDCGAHDLGGVKHLWWAAETRARCLRRKALFIDVYNKITDMDFKNRYSINVKSDTSVSVAENYPDVMGLEAAFNAYKDLLKSDKAHCQTLPNFEKYSCDQMFYIAFANTFCGYYTEKWAKNKLARRSTHSLDSIRVNGAVAQMKSFATAFGCPAGSPMNPQQKANLWQ